MQDPNHRMEVEDGSIVHVERQQVVHTKQCTADECEDGLVYRMLDVDDARLVPHEVCGGTGYYEDICCPCSACEAMAARLAPVVRRPEPSPEVRARYEADYRRRVFGGLPLFAGLFGDDLGEAR